MPGLPSWQVHLQVVTGKHHHRFHDYHFCVIQIERWLDRQPNLSLIASGESKEGI